MKKICPACKTRNEADERFCTKCGRSLEGAAGECPNGHTMDPTWVVCPYCEADAQPLVKVDQPRKEEKNVPNRTEYGGFKKKPERLTEVYREDVTPIPPPPKTNYQGRRVVGIMITYAPSAGDPAGSIYPVREGRTIIGKDPEHCDIVILGDSEISGTHAALICRNGRFVISDKDSMNGTIVDGKDVPERANLRNYAKILLGSTELTFIKAEEARAGAPQPEAPSEDPEPDEPEDRPIL